MNPEQDPMLGSPEVGAIAETYSINIQVIDYGLFEEFQMSDSRIVQFNPALNLNCYVFRSIEEPANLIHFIIESSNDTSSESAMSFAIKSVSALHDWLRGSAQDLSFPIAAEIRTKNTIYDSSDTHDIISNVHRIFDELDGSYQDSSEL